MMQKYLLLIDDDHEQEGVWNEYIEQLSSVIEFNITLYYVNPLDYLDQKNGFEIFKTYLETNFLDKKIDLVACDYSWSDLSKRLSFQTIDFIRAHNKSCNIFMYSGALRDMFEYISEDAKSGREKILRILTKSLVSTFVRREDKSLKNTIKTQLSEPSLLLQIENSLLRFENLSFEYGYDIFNNKTLGEIAKEVRQQSEDGIRYTQYIVEKGLNHMIDLQTP